MRWIGLMNDTIYVQYSQQSSFNSISLHNPLRYRILSAFSNSGTPTTPQHEAMSDAFQRKLETNINRLIESYKTLIKKSVVESSHAPHESLVIAAAAATIVS